jgi:TRAP-type C4-dicarboxylate transport system permease small subunit
MMGVTFIDVIMRLFRHPVTGAYDIVKIAGAVTIAAALPYTTALKGHVAIEYFFHKLSRRGRIILDFFLRMLCIGLFGFSAWKLVLYGHQMKLAGQVTQTLQLPLFWLPYLIAVSFVIVLLVILYNLMHPGKEMIKP